MGLQQEPYAFEVALCSLSESQRCIRFLWKDYFEGLLDEERESMDTDAVDMVTPARDAFLALFADRPEFEDVQSADTFLSQASSLDDPRILPKLLAWGEKRYSKLSRIVSKQPFYAHTVHEVSRMMKAFVKTTITPHYQSNDVVQLESSVWPWIQMVR